MKMRPRLLLLMTSLFAFLPSVVGAHLSIGPNQSIAGATEKYVLRVPNDGKTDIVSAEIDIPEGVTVEAVAIPNGWKHELKRQGDRIVGIVWTMKIPPGQFAEFGFVARNPRDKTELVWTIRDRTADGTVTDWTKGPNGVRAGSLTKLTPRPPQ